MAGFLLVPDANADDVLTGAVLDTIATTPQTVTGLTNGTAYVAYRISDASATFTPAAPVVSGTWEAPQSLTASNDGTGRYSFPFTFTGDEVIVSVSMQDKTGTPLQIRRVLYNDGGADVALTNLGTVRNESDTLNMALEWTDGTTPSAGAGDIIVETWDGTTLADVTVGLRVDVIQTTVTTLQHTLSWYNGHGPYTHNYTNATSGAILLGVAHGPYLVSGGNANVDWTGDVTEDGTETFISTGNSSSNLFTSRAFADGVAAGSVDVISEITDSSAYRQSLASILINP